MNEPLLSVALPVRNGGDFLVPALASILGQTMGDFVLHVSDNASDDATPDILAEFADRDPRVRVSRNLELIPQQANMNRAVRLSTTPWVKLFCHDDLMRPDCLQHILTAIRLRAGETVGLIGHDELHLYANGHTTHAEDGTASLGLGRDVLRKRLTGESTFGLPSVTTATIRRAAFEAQGGFDARWIHFDTFLWFELLMRWDFVHIAMPLTTNRIHARQVAANARAELRSVEDYRQFLPEFLDRNAAALGLSRREMLRARTIPLSVAATLLASESSAGRGRRVLSILAQLPRKWLPVVALLWPRAWLAERRRNADLRGKVPPDLIYP